MYETVRILFLLEDFSGVVCWANKREGNDSIMNIIIGLVGWQQVFTRRFKYISGQYHGITHSEMERE